jgi:type I restriction enzyme, S subunit
VSTNFQSSASIAQRFKTYLTYKASGFEWLGEIPAHWEVRRLKTIAAIQLSNVDKKSVEGEDAVRLCNYTDVYYNERITSDLDFMSATATLEQIRRFALRAGDVLITKDSESWTDIAVPAVVAEDLPDVLCGYHLAHIRPFKGSDGAYLSRVFAAAGPRDQFYVAANGITRFGLGGDAIGSAVFPLPPESEQRAIAAFLDRETARIDALVAKKERLIELLQEKRTALITHAVTKGLDPNVPMKDSGVEWLGETPSHWEVKRWRYCCRITEGQVAPDDDRYRSPVLIAPNHIESGTGRILYTETAAEQGVISGKYLVAEGNIIYSKIRPGLNKVCIATGDWLCSADMYPVAITERELTPQYLLYFMLSDPFVRLMVDESMRVAMPKVNRETLADSPVLLPPSPEQTRLTRFLDEQTGRIDLLITKVREAVDRLHELRTALISTAVTGKIDVREETA